MLLRPVAKRRVGGGLGSGDTSHDALVCEIGLFEAEVAGRAWDVELGLRIVSTASVSNHNDFGVKAWRNRRRVRGLGDIQRRATAQDARSGDNDVVWLSGSVVR